MLVEPLHRVLFRKRQRESPRRDTTTNGSLRVGVLSLPLVEGERLGRSEQLARVLRLGLSGRRGLLLLVVLLRFRCFGGLGRGGSLGRGGFLFGGSVGDGLFDERGRARDGGESGLIRDGVVVSSDVGVSRSESSVEDLSSYISSVSSLIAGTTTDSLESTSEDGGDEDIGEGDSLSDKEGLVGESLFEDGGDLEEFSLGGFGSELVVLSSTGEGHPPAEKVSDQVRVGDYHLSYRQSFVTRRGNDGRTGHVLLDESLVLVGGTEEVGLVGGGEEGSNRDDFEELEVALFESGYLHISRCESERTTSE